MARFDRNIVVQKNWAPILKLILIFTYCHMERMPDNMDISEIGSAIEYTVDYDMSVWFLPAPRLASAFRGVTVAEGKGAIEQPITRVLQPVLVS
jgi:hypothetical protein